MKSLLKILTLVGSQAAADEARFEASRALTELQGRKRYEFLEAMVSSVDAHLRFFENGVKVNHLTAAGPSTTACNVWLPCWPGDYRPASQHMVLSMCCCFGAKVR